MSFWQLVIISCEYPFYTHFVLILEIFPTDIIGINSIEKSYFIWKRDLKRSNELFWLSRGWMAISKQQNILKLKIIEKIIHVLDWNSLPQFWLDHGVFTGKLCSLANSGSSGDPAPHLRSYLWLLHTRITHLSLTGECLTHLIWNSATCWRWRDTVRLMVRDWAKILWKFLGKNGRIHHSTHGNCLREGWIIFKLAFQCARCVPSNLVWIVFCLANQDHKY